MAGQSILVERSVQAGLEGLAGEVVAFCCSMSGDFKELRAVSAVSWELGKRHKEMEQLSGVTALGLRGYQHPKAAPSLQEGR